MTNIQTQVAPEFNIKEYVRIDWIEDYHAEGVTDLIRRTYNINQKAILTQLNYPYPEALDPEWIRECIRNEDIAWKVVTDVITGHIIGSGTVILDRKNKRGYVRGVMIDPDYQGYGLSSHFLVNAYTEFMRKYRNVIKIFWTENRTAHFKSQKISENSGMRPVGLLPYKDLFLKKRESDVIYVIYAMNPLKNRRKNLRLIPEILPIFTVIGRQFRLDLPEIVVTPEIKTNRCNIKQNIYSDKYNYHHATFMASGQKLKFMINPRTGTAEKVQYSPDIDSITLKTLLKWVLIYLQHNLFYMECYASAYRPEHQRVFIDLGFQPTGYIPSWNVVDGKREDIIIMTWIKEMPKFTSMQLTKRAAKIAKLFLS
ncbi:MAG: GNAT family N-acetyltransferase [Promethearchaeota archaeon]